MKDIIRETETQRTIAVIDHSPFDDSYIDTWTDQTDEQREQARRELWELIESEGVWGVILEEKCSECGSWEEVDSCWGIVPSEGYSLEDAAGEYGLLCEVEA